MRHQTPKRLAKRLINSAVCYCCLCMGGCQEGWSGRGRVIGALECVCATRQPVSTVMNRRLRPEPTQLLQGIVGRREAITEISALDECFDPK